MFNRKKVLTQILFLSAVEKVGAFNEASTIVINISILPPKIQSKKMNIYSLKFK